LVVALLALVAGLVGASGSSNATAAPVRPATIWPGANYYHPYSAPIWFPLHSPVRANCIGSSTANNSSAHCSHDHVGYYAMNLSVPLYNPDNTRANPNPYVFSAGAGIVTKVVTGQTCNRTSSSVLPGNVVYVSHGGGVVAVYQHLYSVAVGVGDYVSQKTLLGKVGATGAPCVNGVPAPSYLDFQVRKWGGYATLTNNVPTSIGCIGTTTTAETWPKTLTRDQYYVSNPPTPLPAVWTQVPWGIGIAVNPSWNCIPNTGGSNSPNKITTEKMTRTSATVHTVSWVAVPGATAYSVEVQVEKGSTWTYPCSPFATPGCTYGFYQLNASTTHLVINGAGPYRARVEAYNGVGWSAASSFVVTT